MSTTTVSVFDVAKYILDKPAHGRLTTMKLQKLCFYAQSWHQALLGKPLFVEEFQSWANGPVCYRLFDAHRGQFTVTSADITQGSSDAISVSSAGVVDEVLNVYGAFSGAELSQITHQESPWLQARAGLPAGAMSTTVISLDSMAEHCAALLATSS